MKDTDKEYIATLHLGQTSTTHDPEGEIKITASPEKIAEISSERLTMTFSKFKGKIEQTPPPYSALKIKGAPAYKLARRGEKPILPKREVEIKEIELLERNPPLIKIRVVVSAGTYIRSLAEDIGKTLGVGAYLEELIRTRVGEFKIGDSKTLEELEKNYKFNKRITNKTNKATK